jgi:hypothetical protein
MHRYERRAKDTPPPRNQPYRGLVTTTRRFISELERRIELMKRHKAFAPTSMAPPHPNWKLVANRNLRFGSTDVPRG